MTMSLLIGTSTSGGESKGIYEADFDWNNGSIENVRLIIPQRDPAYLALSQDGTLLYAVMETPRDGQVFSYNLKPDGWVQTGCQPTCGGSPCHLMLNDKTGTLTVSNYADGVVSFYALSQEGALKSPPQAVVLDGHGPHTRQECAHAHQCVQLDDRILISDLGTDRVRVFEGETDKGFVEKAPLLSTLPGDGPRHLVLTADREMLYLLCELQNVVYAYRKAGDGYHEEGRYSYLPEGVHNAAAAAVRLSEDERFLFASSRIGFDGVALFELDKHTRLPKLCGVFPTGACPRDILPVGDFLLCACQEENCLQVMRLDREKKQLVLLGETKVHKPVCVIVKV